MFVACYLAQIWSCSSFLALCLTEFYERGIRAASSGDTKEGSMAVKSVTLYVELTPDRARQPVRFPTERKDEIAVPQLRRL